jgi:hypothetical protein
MIDPWASVQRLLGRWEGPAAGRPGAGHQVREYKLILKGRFILGTDRTSWEPTAEQPSGDLHEGLSILSFDRAAGQLVMRSCYGEGFLHDYHCLEAAPDGSRFVFEASQVENSPPGTRARETIAFMGPDEIESSFELAMPGGDFEPYTHERLKRMDA